MKTLLAIFLGLFAAKTFAQNNNDFAFQISGKYNEYISASASTKDGKLIFGGGFSKQALWKVSTILTSQYEDDIFIIKTDKDGTPIWKKAFGGEGTEDLVNILIDNENNIYLSINFDESFAIDTFNIKSTTYNNSLLVKLNPEGEVLWTKTFESDYDNYPKNIAVNDSGDVFINGIVDGQYLKVENDSFYIGADNGNSSYLFKFDRSGKFEFGKILYCTNSGSVTTKPLAVKNGEIYIGGRIGSYSDIYFNETKINSSFSGMYILKLDDKGDILRSDFYQTETFETSPEYLHINKDGSLYFALTYGDTLVFQNTRLGTTGKFRHPDIAVFKLDKDGKEIWHQNFGSLKQDPIYAATVDKYENLLLAFNFVGNTILAGKEYVPSDSETMILKFDKNGNICNIKYTETHYNNGGGAGALGGVLPMDNGDVYVSGYFIGQTRFSTSTLINSLYIDGFVWKIINFATGIEENSNTFSKSKLLVYPNPTNGIVYLNTTANSQGQSIFTVKDICGKTVYSQKSTNENNLQFLDLSHLPKGTYIIEQISDKSYFSGKVILQ